MNDDSIVKVMQSLGLDYNPAIESTLKFQKNIVDVNKELAKFKDNALKSVKDINNVFSSQLGSMGNKQILDQFGKPFKTIRDEAKAASTTVKDMAKSVKESTLAQMQAQAASIQQRASAKGLSQEYAKQAGTIREQLALIQTRLQAEGKLSAEEVKQTQQLKEQLDILNAQARAGISDKTRENPDWFGEEMQRRVSWFATGGLFYGMTSAAKEATQAIKEVEMGMVEIARVMTDSSFVFDEYRDNLFKLGIDYGQTFTNVQSVALRWAQSGYNVADSLELTKTSLLALNTAELDATQATEAMIGIMAQWQLQAEDMALVMDKINITADRHSVTSQDLVDGLLRSSGAARIMNLSLEETLGLLTVMREASGRTGQEVGNALNSILSYIQRPGSIKTLEDLGISMFADSAKTQFRNVLDIFKDIASNWNTLSADIQDGFVKSADDANLFSEELSNALGMQEEWNDLQQRDISQAAAGVYRRNYFIGMIERLANVQGVLNNMMDAEGYSMRENADAMETLEKKQESLKASMEALAVAMGDAGVGGSLKALADGGTSALTMFTKLPKGAQDTIAAFTSTFLVVKTLQMGMKTFGVELPKVSLSITDLRGSVLNLTSALKSGAAGVGTFIQANAGLLALSAAVGAIIAITNAIKKQREEQEKAIEVAKDNIKSYEEQRQGLIELSREYDTLKDKEKNLTATADEKTRLRDIQRELVELYGVSISGIDAEGQAYADSTNAIRDRIKALEEMKSIEQENLETDVMGRDVQDVNDLENNLNKRLQLEKDILEVQKKIDEYTSVLLNKGTMTVSSQYGSGTIDASTEHGAKILRDYIANTSRDKVALQTALDGVNDAISEGTKDRELLLKEDAVKIANQLSQSGVIISDSARAYATELAKGLSQAPRDIFTLRDELETAIKEFTSSDFEKWSEKYQKAIANNDTKGIDEASNAINGLVRTFTDGKPHLENFALAMESTYANSEALKDAAKAGIDLKTALNNMGSAAKKAFNDLKTLNQAIYDVKRGQSLSVDTILELIEKYDLSTDAIKKTTKGYTIEVSELERLRKKKIDTAIDGIEAEKRQAETIRNRVAATLKEYGLEIEQIKNLGDARRMLAEQGSKDWRKNVTADRVEKIGLEAALEEARENYTLEALEDVRTYKKSVGDLESLVERANFLKDLLKNGSQTVSPSKTKNKPSFLESIDAEIRAIKIKNDYLIDTEKSLQNQLNLAKGTEGLEGFNKQYELTGKLIAHNVQLLMSFKNEQNSVHDMANKIRETYSKFNIDSWFDSNAEMTTTYVEEFNKATKKQQEEMEKVFTQVQKLKKSWMESASEIENVNANVSQLYISQEKLLQQMDKYLDQQRELARKEWIEKQNRLYSEQQDILKSLESIQETIVKIIRKRGEEEKKALDEAHQAEMDSLEERHNQRKKNFQEDLDLYRKNIQAQIDLLEGQWKEEDYQEELKKEKEKADELQRQIDVLSLDDSHISKNKVIQLRKQLAEQNEKIAKMQRDRERDLTKETLQDQLKKYEESINEKESIADNSYENDKKRLEENYRINKDYLDRKYSDERVYAEAKKAIMDDQVEYADGSFMNILDAFKRFEDEFGRGMGILGDIIKEDFIEQLRLAQSVVEEMERNTFKRLPKYDSDYQPTDDEWDYRDPRDKGGSGGNNIGGKLSDMSRSDYYKYLQMKQLWEIAKASNDKASMDYANQEAQRLRDKYGIASDDYSYNQLKDIPYELLKDRGFNVGGKITETGVLIAPFHGRENDPEWIFRDYQLKKIVEDSVLSTLKLTPRINISDLNYNIPRSQSPAPQQPNITIKVDNLVRIDGNVTEDTVPLIQNASDDVLKNLQNELRKIL